MTDNQKQLKDKALLSFQQMLADGMAYNMFLLENKLDLSVKDYEFDEKSYLKNGNNVNFIYEVYFKQGKEKDINRALRSSITSNNGVHYIILNKLFDTVYGNLDKEDFTINDYLYCIIEAIYGTDTILESVSRPEVLSKKIKEIKEYFKIRGKNWPKDHNLYLEFDNIIRRLSEKMGEESDIAINSVPNQEVYNYLDRLMHELSDIMVYCLYKRVDEVYMKKQEPIPGEEYKGIVDTINNMKFLKKDLDNKCKKYVK